MTHFSTRLLGRFFVNQEASRSTLKTWGILIAILLIALATRWNYLPGLGFKGDIEGYRLWSTTIQRHGLFSYYFYEGGRVYPALYVWLLGAVALARNLFVPGIDTLDNSTLVFILKFPQMVAEFILIAAAYFWLTRRPIIQRIGIPLFLAVNP